MTTTLERQSVYLPPESEQVAPPVHGQGRRWPRYLAIGLLGGIVGLAAGVGIGYALRGAEVEQLQTTMSTTMRNDIAPLAQNTPHDIAVRAGGAVGDALAPLSQNTPHDTSGRTGAAALTYDISLAGEHLAQAP